MTKNNWRGTQYRDSRHAARDLGVHISNVRKHNRLHGNLDLILSPEERANKPRPKFMTRYHAEEFKMGGGFAAMILALPEEMQHWLADQIPDGGTMSDVVAAIIVDAYHDETEE